MLGVVFDSASVEGQQDYAVTTSPPQRSSEKGESKFVKMTVMLGGPYGTTQLKALSEQDLLNKILSALRFQLDLDEPLPEPVLTKMWWNEGSIPVFGVGQVEWAEEVRRKVREAFGTSLAPTEGKGTGEVGGDEEDRLERVWVGGAGVSGVSVGDCINSGREGARWVGEMVRLEEMAKRGMESGK
jgi:protoporphyrinogen oxidase